MRRRMRAIVSSVRRMRRDDRGAVIVYVSIMIALLVGLGALAVDVGRVVTVNTQLKNAADAAALAGARELNREAGAQEQARAAAVQAVQNFQTWADDGGGADIVIDPQDCGVPGADDEVAAGESCIRFLSSLPASDEDPITAANYTTADEESRYIEVRVGTRTTSSFFISAVGADPDIGSSARTVAGSNPAICNVPPMFMCNPTETGGGGSCTTETVDNEAVGGKQVNLFRQGGGGQLSPGNFGLLCPLESEDEQGGGANCGAAAIRDALASIKGTCVGLEFLTTKTGVTLQMVRTGVNARLDYFTPQAKTGQDYVDSDGNPQPNTDWRTLADFFPSRNVTQGADGPPNNTGGTRCDYSWETDDDRYGDDAVPKNAAQLYRDPCFDTGNCNAVNGGTINTPRVGGGNWNYQKYFRINHGVAVDDATAPPGWMSLVGSWPPLTENRPPTRFEVHRYELELDPDHVKHDLVNGSHGDNAIVEDVDPIVDDTGTPTGDTVLEDGHTQCFQAGFGKEEPYGFFDPGFEEEDLLKDRRVMPIAVANCNCLSAQGDTSGKFSFAPAEFQYVFISEPMDDPGGGDAEMWVELLGDLGAESKDAIIKDVIQIYRR